jgi:hypothetical protein
MVTIVLCGFKVPVAVFDRFLEANGLLSTQRYTPSYKDGLKEGVLSGARDDASLLLRSKMGISGNTTRLLVPNIRNYLNSFSAYAVYAWLFVFAQRKINLAEELPDVAPPGFAELRREISQCREAVGRGNA